MHPVDGDELLRQRVRDAVVVGRASRGCRRAPRCRELPSACRAACRGSRTSSRASPNFVVGWAMIAGVHSTVWIFAISAAVIRRAFAKSSSSVQRGCSAASRSQIALCSRVKSVCRSASPSQKFPATPVRSSVRVEVARQLAVGVEPQLAALVARGARRDRRLAAVDLRAVPPVRVGVTQVGGPAVRVRGRVGARALGSASAAPAHGSSSASSSSNGSSGRFLPWLNQSCTSNWSHAPASTFSVVAGLELSRVSSSRLTRRGFGVEQLGSSLGERVLERDVAAEARADASPSRAPEVVVAAVDRPRVVRGRASPDRPSRPPASRVVEVLLAEPRRGGRPA